jgi:rare lipoprotein A
MLVRSVDGPKRHGRSLDHAEQVGRLWRAGTVGTFVVWAYLAIGACSWLPTGDSQLDVGIKERGIASWYGAPFHGKVTASGERFDMEALTAAHRTLPMGSMVRVVNLLNGQHVRVRITDRGPYVAGRILDLSYAAAVRLGMVETGLSVVQLEVIGDRRPDFVLDAEERDWSVPVLLPLSDVSRPIRAVAGRPVWRKGQSTSAEAGHATPHDLLWDRRWIGGTAAFPVDVAYRTAAVLPL